MDEEVKRELERFSEKLKTLTAEFNVSARAISVSSFSDCRVEKTAIIFDSPEWKKENISCVFLCD